MAHRIAKKVVTKEGIPPALHTRDERESMLPPAVGISNGYPQNWRDGQAIYDSQDNGSAPAVVAK